MVNFLLFDRVNFTPSFPQTDTEPDQEHHKYDQDHEHDNTDRYQNISHGVAGFSLRYRRAFFFRYTLKVFHACTVIRGEKDVFWRAFEPSV